MPKVKAKTRPKTKQSKLTVAVSRCAELLTTGSVLAIDPSISSVSSSMGYSLYESGVLKDAGIIEIDSRLPKNKKLRMINESLSKDFPVVDVLVVENIAPMRSGPTSMAITLGWKNLHQATGAAISSVECKFVVEVAPISWRAHIDSSYDKRDAGDAILIGYTAIAEACRQLKLPKPVKHFLVNETAEGI